MSDFLRSRNRLAAPCYVGRNSYFVTICAGDRRPILAKSEIVAALEELLRLVACRQSFEIYAFCFMPDHLHVAVVGLAEQSSLPRFIRDFKGRATPILRKLGVQKAWQKGYYDHVNRPGELEEVAAYIFENPIRAGLVKSIYDWPYSGSFMFDWKRFSKPSNDFVPPWKARKTSPDPLR